MSNISSSKIEKGHKWDWSAELNITLLPEICLLGWQWYLRTTCFYIKTHQTDGDQRVLLLNPRITTFRNLILKGLIHTDLQWIHKKRQKLYGVDQILDSFFRLKKWVTHWANKLIAATLSSRLLCCKRKGPVLQSSLCSFLVLSQ